MENNINLPSLNIKNLPEEIYTNKIHDFLKKLFDNLDRNGCKYCILHGHDSIPIEITTDLDIVVDRNPLKLRLMIEEAGNETGFKLYQMIRYDTPYSYAIYLYTQYNDQFPKFIKLDVLYDFCRLNKYHLDSKSLLKHRKKIVDCYVLDTSFQLCYLLIKRIVKGKISNKQWIEIKDLYRKSATEIFDLLNKYIGKKRAIQILKIIDGDNVSEFKEKIKLYRSSLIIKRFTRKPHSIMLYLYFFVSRMYERIRYPSGLIIAFVGPDGSGKSTIAEKAIKNCEQGFWSVKYTHWRPNFLPPLRKLLRRNFANTLIPHGESIEKSCGTFVSLIRFFYYLFDFMFGFFPKLWIPKIRTTLVVLDRYYCDFLVDPKRYGLKLPRMLFKIFNYIVPQPDIIFFISGSSNEIFKRKQELSINEISRQLESYRKIFMNRSNVVTIDNNRPLGSVAKEVTTMLLNYKSKKILA